ncbi:hypothetical protein KL86DYS1_30525 [uncultured Dysgonomonas sp.]|uniref:Uncharacterized protein n=1 Tax=uncultured Dysgonomonas sp. TaxID=206096 RepID=A0A212JV23_9BACT|nr:hypothetical protein KL86DYS1_30525 [uncultured Dysgonomonas sp.]
MNTVTIYLNSSTCLVAPEANEFVFSNILNINFLSLNEKCNTVLDRSFTIFAPRTYSKLTELPEYFRLPLKKIFISLAGLKVIFTRLTNMKTKHIDNAHVAKMK